MDREKKFHELMEMFLKIMNKRRAMEDEPKKYGTQFLLYKSEIHTIETIGHNPQCNMTELSERLGITKGALSQVVGKLKKKGLVVKKKKSDNEKEVFLELTDIGHTAFLGHQEFHKNHFEDLKMEFDKLQDDQIELIQFVFNLINSKMDKFLNSDEGCACCQDEKNNYLFPKL